MALKYLLEHLTLEKGGQVSLRLHSGTSICEPISVCVMVVASYASANIFLPCHAITGIQKHSQDIWEFPPMLSESGISSQWDGLRKIKNKSTGVFKWKACSCIPNSVPSSRICRIFTGRGH